MIERVAFILLVNILFFAKTITYKYCSDDIPSSRRPHSKPAWKHWLYVLEGREKSTMQADHALTMAIHALVCAGIYLGFGANDVSFLAALLFSFNPANNQGSVWISGRSYALPALGMTMAMTFPQIAVLPLLGATYFNAGFATLVVLMASSIPKVWMAFCLFFCWAFHWKRFKLNVGRKIKKEAFTADRKIHWRKLVLFTKTFGFYTSHALLPIKTAFYHSFLQSAAGCMNKRAMTMKDRFFWLGVGFALLFGWLIYDNMGTLLSFGLLWWMVCLFPFLNLFRIHQEIGERYMYLPNVGLMVALASLINGHPAITAMFITAYATKLWFYMDAYTDDYYLVEYARLHSPDAWFPWHVAGMKRWDTQSYKEAVILWTMARMISPREYKVNFNLATALKMSNHPEEADRFMAIAEANIPGGQEVEAGKLIAEWRGGKFAILL